MRISMTSPTPFCPSFDPCEKLTLVHVKMSTVLIQPGGGASFFGSLKRLSPYDVFLVRLRRMNIRIMVIENPKSGETRSDNPISFAFVQFTAASVAPGNNEKATPTPRIDPIKV